mmetsp:Transcript_6810/g.8966  ORF Transcript_6810/g.8966 Transcript_6810/m.8966 type:complete len:210 (-) Transcript_6810:56-685(-)
MEFMDVKDGMEKENYENDDFEIFDEDTMKEIEEELQEQLKLIEEQGGVEDKSTSATGEEEQKKEAPVAASTESSQRESSETTIQHILPKIQALEAVETILDHPVGFQLLVMDRTLYVWCGPGAGPSRTMGGLHTAVGTKFDPMPLVSTLVEPPGGNDAGASMAQRIAKKTGYMCLVSCNIDDSVEFLLPNVEKTIMVLFNQTINRTDGT